MKDKINKKIKDDKGIIAVLTVVKIIIFSIFAAIIIALLVGDNGLLRDFIDKKIGNNEAKFNVEYIEDNKEITNDVIIINIQK